jgi:hypothetical protein
MIIAMVSIPIIRSPSGDKAGALASFPYDRATVQRFREAFPRARWNEDERSWFVPGVRAERRLQRWFAREFRAGMDHEDGKGRDAFAFDPIESSYLEVADDLRIRTPYSRTVVDAFRAIPWSWWDETLRAWRVPFRSYEDLRRRWPAIEEAARRNEPAERQRRREQEKHSNRRQSALRRAAERRRHRYPVAACDPPPLYRPVMTQCYGIVVFEEVAGEFVDPEAALECYPHAGRTGTDYVWGSWRSPTAQELNTTWPARSDAEPTEQARGWWRPSRDDLREARRKLRALARARSTRRSSRESSTRAAGAL